MSGVYSELVRRFKVASDGPGATLAGAAVHPMQQAAHALPPAARPILPVTDVAVVTKAFAVAAAHPSAAPSATGAAPIAASPTAASQAAPTFNSLFSDQDRRTAVDPLVVALWSVPASLPQPDGAPAAPQPTTDLPATKSTGAASFDLFQNIRPNVGALFGDGS